MIYEQNQGDKVMTAQKRTKAAAAILLAAALSGAGCDGSAPDRTERAADGAKPVIGVLLYKEDDTYITLVHSALRRELEDRSTLLIESAGNNPLTQHEQVEDMLAKKVNVLAVNLVDPKAASQVLDRAQKDGVPVIFFNREPDPEIIKSYARACFVGTEVKDAGILLGDIIARLWEEHPEYDRNGDGVFNYVMFQGEPDNPEALARTEFSVSEARNRGVRMRQVGATHICDWDAERARRAMELTLAERQDELELVVSNNDAMALGAIAALAERGYNLENGDPARFIPVVGVDAIPQAMEAIRKGVMSATVRQDGEGMARAVAAFALNGAAGRDFLEGTGYAWDESGVAVRIPYSPYSGDED
jgi:methyl-galactoside transport system substrate-binding protein